MTHTPDSPSPDPRRDRRGRLVLLAIAGLFFGVMLVAGLLRFSGWRPAGSNVHGEMLEPLVDLRERAPVLLDGDTYAWNPPARTWRIAVAPPADCGQACNQLATDLDKVWRLMGRRADQIDILWLCPDAACVVPSPLGEDRTLRRLRPDADLRAALPRVDARDGGGVPVYVLDPNGFVILRYPPGSDPGGLRADLAKLLKLI
jgi:hypothetical protein